MDDRAQRLIDSNCVGGSFRCLIEPNFGPLIPLMLSMIRDTGLAAWVRLRYGCLDHLFGLILPNVQLVLRG